MLDIDVARQFLKAADIFFDTDDGDPRAAQTLNQNDRWAWACADGEYVPDEDLPRVAAFYHRYGDCGLLYWVSEKHNGMRSAFEDVNRFIDFVRHEEKIRSEEPSNSRRAYFRRSYQLGGLGEKDIA